MLGGGFPGSSAEITSPGSSHLIEAFGFQMMRLGKLDTWAAKQGGKEPQTRVDFLLDFSFGLARGQIS